MEMPELNEDILEGEANQEGLAQGEDAASLDENALQPEEQMPMDVDGLQKTAEGDEEGKIAVNQDGIGDSFNEGDMKQENDLQENLPQEGVSDNCEDKSFNEEEPEGKRLKLDEEGKMEFVPEDESEANNPEPEPEAEEPQPESQPEEEQQPVQDNQNELQDIKKEDDKDDIKVKAEKTGPDTDMLATLASAALEQDPKDKTVAAPTPARPPSVKVEPEVPKKKLEAWCNVGVFDTNTTIVTDYVATPEPNEEVDLVTATLGGRRIQLEPGTAYKFRVCAVNGCGTGPWSDIAAFKTTLPGYPGAPSAIKISKSPDGAHLTWEPPGGNSGEILEYAVYLAVRSASQGSQPVTTNQAQLAFVRVFCGPTNKCVVGTNSLQAAHIDTTTKPAIIFRIAARNDKGYGPATQVRWLQESQNGTAQGVKRAVKA
ncbi:UNVERIFIED_CONTAM: hypothetical protein PYX00_001813 [Menopon gallinae]|uniref:Fibronectin type-III domain-containing protein n=1 Tax=Menopon gallinae TaxID=328185 RepID=A0AAW2IFJ6_9NEOP